MVCRILASCVLCGSLLLIGVGSAKAQPEERHIKAHYDEGSASACYCSTILLYTVALRFRKKH